MVVSFVNNRIVNEDDDTDMKVPPEEEVGLLLRAYTMSIGFYRCDSLLACFLCGFAGMK
jgi:hypothetical protein